MNPAAEFVQGSREQSPIHAYIADNGEPVNGGDIEHVTIDGHPVAVPKALTPGERALVADAIRATEPVEKAYFANSLEMWQYNDRFTYAEGFAVASEFDIGGFGHAWCMLDGEKLVDVTTPFDHYYGVVVADEDTLRRYCEIGKRHGTYGIIGNHHDRFAFLRERGYIEGRERRP